MTVQPKLRRRLSQPPTTLSPLSIPPYELPSLVSTESFLRKDVLVRKYRLISNESGSQIKGLVESNAIWTKTRTLSETEIIETIYDNNDDSRWQIHKPRAAGWYIALRTATSSDFIALTPVSDSTTSLEFDLSNTHAAVSEEADDQSTTTTKEAKGIPPPSPNVRLNFDVPPSNHYVIAVTNPLIRPSRFSYSTLARICGEKAHVFTCTRVGGEEIFRFEEEVSLMSVETRGVITLNEGVINETGLAKTFWISVLLAYLEFVSDREAYIAATD